MSAFTDCLVLCIKEIDNDDYDENKVINDNDNDNDNDSNYNDENETDFLTVDTMYIIYDTIKEQYFICGKKQENEDTNYSPYHFYCKRLKHVLKYIRLVTVNKLNISVFNFKKLPNSCDELNYYILRNMTVEENKIIEYYDTDDTAQSELKDFLKIMKRVKNDYVII
jgi:hypothetical protein